MHRATTHSLIIDSSSQYPLSHASLQHGHRNRSARHPQLSAPFLRPSPAYRQPDVSLRHYFVLDLHGCAAICPSCVGELAREESGLSTPQQVCSRKTPGNRGISDWFLGHTRSHHSVSMPDRSRRFCITLYSQPHKGATGAVNIIDTPFAFAAFPAQRLGQRNGQRQRHVIPNALTFAAIYKQAPMSRPIPHTQHESGCFFGS